MEEQHAREANALRALKVTQLLKHGFTLVELMVVIGIIAALAGILFVVFSSARESARRQVCVSNLRQIGQALQMYRADWNGIEASPGQELEYWQLGVPAGEAHLNYFVEHYCKGWAIFRCPSASIPPTQLNSYPWYPGPDDPSISASWKAWVKKRGEEAMVTLCDWHNPVSDPIDLVRRPYWETKLIILLRLNGQIAVKRVPTREWAPDRW